DQSWRVFFFFSSRRRHTRWPRDWSSDVCSSDLYASGGTGTWPVEKTVEQAQLYIGLGFRALKLGTGFTDRPGGLWTGNVPPPYGTWHAGTTGDRIEDERAKFAGLRATLGQGVELAIDG